MRFDTPIYFVRNAEMVYDTTTGDYVTGATGANEDMRFADITDTGVNALQLVYGELRQGSKTIRIQDSYTQPFDQIRIGTKLYKVDFTRTLRSKQTFIVSEVQ